MTRAEAEAIYDLGKEAVVKMLLEMDTRMRRLEERLGMDSTNSSKPPSTDNKLTKSSPQKSTDKKTKRGGQKGHKGSTLLQRDTPDFTEVIKPTTCSKCQSSLEGYSSYKITKRQVFDIPKANINVKEYQGHSIVCSCCHHKNHTIFPNGVNAPTQYGKNLSAFIAYLHSYQMVPYERITQLIDDLYSHKLSTGTIITMLQKTYDATQESETHTKALLKRSPLLHCDETGVSVEGRLHWIHVASTSHLTYFLLHKRRGQTATDAMGILPTYTGIVKSDHWAAYKN
jgi:transposase